MMVEAVARRPEPEIPLVDERPSLDLIYRDHAATVARWVARLGGRGHVEDLVHEVFVTVGRRLHTLQANASVGVWLFRITQKILANHRRRQRFRRWMGMTPRMAETIAGAAPAPSDRLELQQATASFYRILETLPEQQQKVLVLFELEELTTPEIAELLDCKVATVRVWLSRARAAFLEEQRRLAALEAKQ